MARKPIEVFSISFLDLLSGALGAVILLYVIVPRMTVSMQEFESQRKLKEEIDKLELKVDELQSAVPKDLFEKLRQHMSSIIKINTELDERVDATKTMLNDCLQQQNEDLTQIDSLQETTVHAKQGAGECGKEMEKLAGTLKFLV